MRTRPPLARVNDSVARCERREIESAGPSAAARPLAVDRPTPSADRSTEESLIQSRSFSCRLRWYLGFVSNQCRLPKLIIRNDFLLTGVFLKTVYMATKYLRSLI